MSDCLRGQTFVIVHGCYCRSVAEGEALLSYWGDWRTPQFVHFGLMPFSAAATISADPVDLLPAYNTSAWLSALSDQAIDAIVDHAVIADGSVPLNFAEIRHADGVIRSVPAEAAVVGNRDAEFVLSIVSITPFPAAQQLPEKHCDSLKAALQPVLTGGVYMNFLEGEESRRRIRDGLVSGAYDRLAKIKSQVDPENVQRDSFNVAPA